MSLSHLETIRNLLDEGATEPANCEPLLPRISGIRTVVFDVYGTLLSSGCCKKHPRAESIVDRLLPAILEGHDEKPKIDRASQGTDRDPGNRGKYAKI